MSEKTIADMAHRLHYAAYSWGFNAGKVGANVETTVAANNADTALKDVIAASASNADQIRKLREALDWFEFFHGRDGEGSLERFERVAERFYRETGYLRPGKDCRINSMEERQAAWDEWIAKNLSAARAALKETE
jgi:hypothetical protein